MKAFLRGWLFLALLCLLPMSAKGQTRVNVSGTVVDPDGVPYAGATVQSTLISPGGPSPSLTPCNNPQAGCPLAAPWPATTAGPDGSFHFTLYANSSILPAGTQWQFTVAQPGINSPWGTNGQTLTYQATINTDTNLSTPLKAIAKLLTVPFCNPDLTGQAGCGGTGSGCMVSGFLASWVLFVQPDATCDATADWTWDVANQNMQAGDGSNSVMGSQLTFVEGSGNSATNMAQAWVRGEDNTLVSDALDDNENWFIDGHNQSITANTAGGPGAGTPLDELWSYSALSYITVTNGGNVAGIACLIYGCDRPNGASAFQGIQIVGNGSDGDTTSDTDLMAGTANGINATASGVAGTNISSMYEIGEFESGRASAGCNTSDIFFYGELSTVQCSMALTADVDSALALGFRISLSATTHNLTDVYAIGETLTGTQSSGADIDDMFFFGDNLTQSNCSHCFAIGENFTNMLSNWMGFGLSATPEFVITPGNTLFNGVSVMVGNGTLFGFRYTADATITAEQLVITDPSCSATWGCVIPATTSTVSGVIGVAIQNASATQLVAVASTGVAAVGSDGPCTAGQAVVPSTTTAALGHCTSSPTAQIIGYDQTNAGGSATIVVALAIGFSGNNLPASPTVNGSYPCGYTVTASVAVPVTCPEAGLGGNTISGATSDYTVLFSNNLQVVNHDAAASVPLTVTIPTTTDLTNPAFGSSYENDSNQTDALTPCTIGVGCAATRTINGASSLPIPPDVSVRYKVDPFNATNWLASRVQGGITVAPIATKTGNYTLTNSDSTILCNGTFTLTLPTTGIKVGKSYRIKFIAASGTCTISSSVNIDGAMSTTLTTQYASYDLQWDGTQWWKL